MTLKISTTKEFWESPASSDTDLVVIGPALTEAKFAKISSPRIVDDEAERAREKFDLICWE